MLPAQPEGTTFRMTDIATLSARIATLEMAKMHQDRTIEDLNEALARQWKEIEALTRQVARLSEQLEDGAGRGSARSSRRRRIIEPSLPSRMADSRLCPGSPILISPQRR